MTANHGDCFVRTADIRAAVKGRESEVLEALGIDWRSGRPHIECPYPDHTDSNPSWRWNAQRAQALCTCIDKADSVFDVVIKVRAVDFEDAKILVAEFLHRDDLIRTKGAGGQKTDPASLLNPPASNRDDGLPACYLAGRLGLADPAAVPLPATRMAGWRALAYYEPPGKGAANGTPVLVGHWPCIVFETVAADGRRHAQRIYLRPDGRGKAELGPDPNGKARNPKKAARRDPNGPSTAGCCVAWGDPDNEHIILAEGIENADAVALSFGGEQPVLSAVNAVGVESFAPWASTRIITVAADRDEAKKGAGFKRGERAAKNLAMRLAAEGRDIEVRIALPGSTGTNYDFLDLYRDSDPDRVRKVILEAAPFQPSAEEIAEFEGRGRRRTVLEELAAAFWLPPLIGLRVDWRYTETDEIWLYRFKGTREDKQTGDKQEIWEAISSPFGNFVLLLSVGEHSTHGLRVHIRNFAGTADTIDFMRAELPKLGASGVRAAMMGAGVRVANGGEVAIVDILKQVQPGEFIQITTAFGWTETEGDSVFLTPGGKNAKDYRSKADDR
jgi:hypothetical protein